MPSLKAKTLRELTQEKVLLELGRRLANSIPRIVKTRPLPLQYVAHWCFYNPICRSQIYHLFFRQFQKQNLPSAFGHEVPTEAISDNEGGYRKGTMVVYITASPAPNRAMCTRALLNDTTGAVLRLLPPAIAPGTHISPPRPSPAPPTSTPGRCSSLLASYSSASDLRTRPPHVAPESCRVPVWLLDDGPCQEYNACDGRQRQGTAGAVSGRKALNGERHDTHHTVA